MEESSVQKTCVRNHPVLVSKTLRIPERFKEIFAQLRCMFEVYVCLP